MYVHCPTKHRSVELVSLHWHAFCLIIKIQYSQMHGVDNFKVSMNNVFPASQKTHSIPSMKDWLVNAVKGCDYSDQNHIKYINMLCRQTAEFVNVNADGTFGYRKISNGFNLVDIEYLTCRPFGNYSKRKTVLWRNMRILSTLGVIYIGWFWCWRCWFCCM